MNPHRRANHATRKRIRGMPLRHHKHSPS
jgi:hypothetical protein